MKERITRYWPALSANLESCCQREERREPSGTVLDAAKQWFCDGEKQCVLALASTCWSYGDLEQAESFSRA